MLDYKDLRSYTKGFPFARIEAAAWRLIMELTIRNLVVTCQKNTRYSDTFLL